MERKMGLIIKLMANLRKIRARRIFLRMRELR
jgi:hypothetical protein